MWIMGGGFTALGTAVIAWLLFGLGSRNLPHTAAQAALWALLVIAVTVGFVAGAAVAERARRRRQHLTLFAGLSGAVAGGTVGAAYAVILTVAYLNSYSSWPQDRVDQVLVLLAYPVFGGLGFCLGAPVGIALGALAGGILRLAAPREQMGRPGRPS